jgi:hypothetical protein
MNRITAIAVYIALTASTGISAHAQTASIPDVRAGQTQRASEPVIRCTLRDAVSRATQPCAVQRTNEATRLGTDVTRQEFECVLSGNCGVADRGRLNG